MKMHILGLFIACCIVINASADGKHGESLFIDSINSYLQIPQITLEKMQSLVTPIKKKTKRFPAPKHRPLFDAFPALKKKIVMVELGDLPTPVQPLKEVSKKLGGVYLWVKRDDLSGKLFEDGTRLFGGNKIRKMEFIMAQAVQEGAQAVIAMGCVGSNLVTAVAACADYLGLRMLGMIKSQPNAHVVQRNLLLMDYYGTEFHVSANAVMREKDTIVAFLQEKIDHGVFPYFIPIGASTPLGVLGFVNAAFELKEQIKKRLLPEPDRIYVAAGQSVGTYVGLLIGAKAAGLKSKIIAVAVEPDKTGLYKREINKLFAQTVALLRSFDSSFPQLKLHEEDVSVIYDASGPAYALFTKDGVQAMKMVKSLEGIELDGVYSGKAFAGMLADIKRTAKSGSKVLFWNTFYGGDVSTILADMDYKNLPKELHLYFESPVQELDRS